MINFDVNKEINVISDKAYRISSENRFQAIGNVIILHFDNAIYGEKADLNFNTGEVNVDGNVRYVGSGLTIYGTKLYYNMQTKTMNIENARVISPDYTIVGKLLAKTGEETFEGEEAEYTTCKDCPESWSIYGEKIKITEGEYIRIRNGYVKLKGIVAFYFPYLLFPIKKERESGLLFPKLGFNFADGIRYQQPYFLVLGDKSDMTITPSTWGKRGFGGEYEFRTFFSDLNWVRFDSVFADDKVYEPFKDEITLSNDKQFRHFSTWEHHFSKGMWFNHHFKFSEPSDLDLIRDYDFYALNKLQGSEIGGESFFDFRLPMLSTSIYSGFYQNLLYDQPKELDHRYVQIQPEVNFNFMPVNLFYSSTFPVRSVYLDFRSTWTNFKQNHLTERSEIRNASRFHLLPRIRFNFRNFGPVNLSTQATYDFQSYAFRNGDRGFKKSVVQYETELSFEVEKIFGFSYEANIDAKEIVGDKKETPQNQVDLSKQNNIVGNLKTFGQNESIEKVKIVSNSYRHRQRYKIKNYLLSNIRNEGNPSFLEQIQLESGQFDRIDTLRQQEFQNDEGPSITIPLTNTIEFGWNNSLIKKAPVANLEQDPQRLFIDQYEYSQLGYFNISQAYDLDTEEVEVKQKLTRLFIEGGLNLEKFRIRGREYYFYDSDRHIFSSGIGFNLPNLKLNIDYIYNTQIDPIRELVNFGGQIDLFNKFQFNANYEYDLYLKRIPRSIYSFIYSPSNDCWKLRVDYRKDLIEGRLSFNFLLKFNEKNFSSLSDIY